VANCKAYNANLACVSCLRDFYLNGQVCTAVSASSLISNCNVYANGTACASCDDGYYLSINQAQCLQGSQNATCRAYINATACASCPNGYRLANAQCTLVSNCQASNGVNCTQCAANYTLNSDNLCQLTSTSGIDNCALVNSTGSCVKCQQGAIFDYQMKSCVSAVQVDSQIDPNCIDQRLSNGTMCSLCRQGYKLNSASRCDLVMGQETCLIHDPDNANTCRVCMSGYYMTVARGSCTPNPVGYSGQVDPASAAVLKLFNLVLLVVLGTQLG
jgi:hypothetical protein